jgi:hypothetical protein
MLDGFCGRTLAAFRIREDLAELKLVAAVLAVDRQPEVLAVAGEPLPPLEPLPEVDDVVVMGE